MEKAELDKGIELVSSLMNWLAASKNDCFDLQDCLQDCYNSLTEERFELLKKQEQIIPDFTNAIHDGHSHRWNVVAKQCDLCGCNYPY